MEFERARFVRRNGALKRLGFVERLQKTDLHNSISMRYYLSWTKCDRLKLACFHPNEEEN